jgi:hypothetical protein
MQISNIQENLAKTELVQRLQQIMQDAARAAQAAHVQENDERSRIAMEQVAEGEETENEGIREDGGRGEEEAAERRQRRKQEQDADEDPPKRRYPPSVEGRILDVTV